jgi:hypothetical protein
MSIQMALVRKPKVRADYYDWHTRPGPAFSFDQAQMHMIGMKRQASTF